MGEVSDSVPGVSMSGNNVSRVWYEDGWAYKKQPKFLTINEFWCLRAMYPTGYVPYTERVSLEVIRTEFIEREPITLPDLFMSHLPKVLEWLQEIGIRHGDLTEYSVIPRDNKPYVIDWAESRLECDPRPDKRPEGDTYWLERTMKKICEM